MLIRIQFFHFFRKPLKKKEYLARKLIGFSPEQMFAVVSDVKNYKYFVPFCTRSTIIEESLTYLKANLEIGFPPIYENYTSSINLNRPNLVKAICYDGRLFHYLETTWKFNPGLKSNPNSSIVDFYISFEFKSMMYSQLATIFFDRLCNEMEEAFIEEAKRRYGPESIPSHSLGAVK